MKQTEIHNFIKSICKISADIGKWTLMGSTIISCAWTGFVAPRADPADIKNIINHTFMSGEPIPMVGPWGDGRYIDYPDASKGGTQKIIRVVVNYIGNPDANHVTRIYLSLQTEKPADRMRGVRCPPGKKCTRRDILFLEDHGANGSCDASSEVIAFVEKHEGVDLILIYEHVPGNKNRQAKYDAAIHLLAGKISNREP